VHGKTVSDVWGCMEKAVARMLGRDDNLGLEPGGSKVSGSKRKQAWCYAHPAERRWDDRFCLRWEVDWQKPVEERRSHAKWL